MRPHGGHDWARMRDDEQHIHSTSFSVFWLYASTVRHRHFMRRPQAGCLHQS